MTPPLLMFNLAHDTLVKFRSDSSCELYTVEEPDTRITLDRKAQLLLLDALCHVYQFPSPLAGIVTKSEVGTSNEPDAEGETDHTYIDKEWEQFDDPS